MNWGKSERYIMEAGLTNIPVIDSTSQQMQVKCRDHSWEGVTSDREICNIHEIHQLLFRDEVD